MPSPFMPEAAARPGQALKPLRAALRQAFLGVALVAPAAEERRHRPAHLLSAQARADVTHDRYFIGLQ